MKKKKATYVLGTGLSHDGSVCLLKDGEVVVAVEKERISRKKHDGYNDNLALNYCLQTEGIKLEDVDLVVQSGGSQLYVEKNRYLRFGAGERIIDHAHPGIPVINISHHLAHAYSAVGSAPFEDMAILVIDGLGQSMLHCIDLDGTVLPNNIPEDWKHLFYEKDSFYIYRNNKLTPLFKDFSCRTDYPIVSMSPICIVHSVGEMYEQASSYCLGNPEVLSIGLAGKLMGLAPYGRPGIYNEEIFKLKDGRAFVNYDWQEGFNKPCLNYKDFKNRFQYFADIAYWVQTETEKAIFYLINERAKLCNTKNLAYTGGVALNAVANAKIKSNSPFENIYITPAAGDNGLGLGCAYYGWLEVLKKKRKPTDGRVYYGKKYSDDFILHAIRSFKNYNNLPIKEIVASFFDSFHKCIVYDKLPESFFCVQFIVKDCGVYCLEFKEGKYNLNKDIGSEPVALITVPGIALIKWLHGSTSILSLLEKGEIQIEGNIEHLESCFNASMAISILDELIDMHCTERENVYYTKEDDVTSKAAQLLAEGNTVGWFQGGSEFGPRALGHRSILADPRRADIQEIINSTIKFREDFRPFAPSVLQEDVSKYFLFEGESPYMLLVSQIRPEWKDIIPGVVHKDNSCRLQTVTEEQNDRFYQLLVKFKEYTGIGILLNTSFNRRSMPIVETPQEALNFFYECALDYLIMEDYVIRKK